MFLWNDLYTSTCNKSKLSTISSLHQIYNLLFKRLIQTLGDDISIDWLYWYIYRFQTHHNLYRDIDNVHLGHILYLRNQKSTKNWENVKLLKKVFFKLCFFTYCFLLLQIYLQFELWQRNVKNSILLRVHWKMFWNGTANIYYQNTAKMHCYVSHLLFGLWWILPSKVICTE